MKADVFVVVPRASSPELPVDGDGLTEALGDTLAEGLADALGDCDFEEDADGLTDSDIELEVELEGLVELDGDTL